MSLRSLLFPSAGIASAGLIVGASTAKNGLAVMQKYRMLFGYAGRQGRRFAIISGLTLAASLLTALQPWPMKLVVDHVLGKLPIPPWLASLFQSSGLTVTPLVLLAVGAVGGLLLFALNSILEMLLTTTWTVAGRQMVYDFAQDLFTRLQSRSLIFHTRNSVGDVISRITGDSWCVYQVVDALLFAPAHALLTIVLMLLLMAQLDSTLTMVAIVTAPFMVGASFVVGKPLQAAARIKREIESRIQAHIQQTLTGIPVVQAFAQEERENARFREFAGAAIRAQQKGTLLGSINSLSSGLVTTVGAGIVLWVGAQHVLQGRLSIGSILVFIVYLTSLQAQIKVFANMHSAFRGFQASVDRVFEIMETMPEVTDKPKPILLSKARGAVQFEEVTFGYQPGEPILRGISMRADPGEIVAIVGATGAGKTTLVNLIPRFFDPWAGRVSVDRTDLRDLQLKSLRGQVAMVLQEPFLFPFTVAENIAFGRPDAKHSEIEAAARNANAHDFIQNLPEGYDTVLGERAANLSGGERQRLSIARAFLKDAPILILDEPTSALDPQTENLLLQSLAKLMAGRTTFIIAHRLSTIRQANRILVLQEGRITESGTHTELLARGKFYARMHNIQFEPT